MSWRTRGRHTGLGAGDQEYLRAFNREWDTKLLGRSQTDALDFLSSKRVPTQRDFTLIEIESGDMRLEAELATLAGIVKRFTVPKPLTRGWSIHLVLVCGRRVRVHFQDHGDALHAYSVLQELSLILKPC